MELQLTLVEISKQLTTLSQSSVWQTLSTQTDWSAWFEQQAVTIQHEIDGYERDLELAKLKDAA
jgi:hypothetical protein